MKKSADSKLEIAARFLPRRTVRRSSCSLRVSMKSLMVVGGAVLWLCSVISLHSAEAKADSYPIDLPTVLRMADAQNLDIQLARQRLAEAQANESSSQWQLFPWLSPGVAYRKHEGRIQAVDGPVFDASKSSYAPGVTL